MSEPIVSIEDIKRRARKNFAEGEPCPFPWHSEAAKTWRAEHARLVAEYCPERREVA